MGKCYNAEFSKCPSLFIKNTFYFRNMKTYTSKYYIISNMKLYMLLMPLRANIRMPCCQNCLAYLWNYLSSGYFKKKQQLFIVSSPNVFWANVTKLCFKNAQAYFWKKFSLHYYYKNTKNFVPKCYILLQCEAGNATNTSEGKC